MNSKVVVCLVVLVVALGVVLGEDAQPSHGGEPTNDVGGPVGYCSRNWRGSWSQYLSDRWNCHAFYECSNGVPVHFRCPTGTCWNNHIKTCDHNGSAGCRFPCNK